MMNRKQRRHHLQPPGTPAPPPAGLATQLEPASLAGVVEDHAYEQFFFDESTRDSLLSLLGRFERPLLLCVPSLAVNAEARNMSYLLLDRDERFSFLQGFRRFDIENAESQCDCVNDYDYDAIIVDPPFANIDLQRLRQVLELLESSSADACDRQRRSRAPVYFAFNSKREEELLETFADFHLEAKSSLGYSSVSAKTQKWLFLYHLVPRGSAAAESERPERLGIRAA